MESSEGFPPTRRGRETLGAIDAAARKVISEKGFLKMTVADIVNEAGKSPASFYNYYDSKEALLEHWAREFQADVRQRVMTTEQNLGKHPRERIHAAVQAHWETYRDRLAEMVGVFQLAMINDDFERVWGEICAEPVAAIERAVDRAQARGYCPGIDPHLTATGIVAMLNMFCYEKLANGGAEHVNDSECIAALASIWHHAIYWKV